MNKITQYLSISVLVLALAACGSSSSGPTILKPNPPIAPEPEDAYLRVHHAAADAPAVNITVSGNNFLESIDYQVSSGIASVE